MKIFKIRHKKSGLFLVRGYNFDQRTSELSCSTRGRIFTSIGPIKNMFSYAMRQSNAPGKKKRDEFEIVEYEMYETRVFSFDDLEKE